MFCFSAFQTKLTAVENSHREDLSKLNQQIQQLQGENASLRDEEIKLTIKMEQFESRLQQGWFYCILVVVSNH